jgi:hypothetical protein
MGLPGYAVHPDRLRRAGARGRACARWSVHQTPASNADYLASSRPCSGEAPVGAVVERDPASVDPDCDNGAALRIRVAVDGRVREYRSLGSRYPTVRVREKVKSRWDAYWVDLCRVTRVMSSSCSHPYPVKERSSSIRKPASDLSSASCSATSLPSWGTPNISPWGP